MAGISFGGLASGIDSDSIIQQLISIESRPITLLAQQQTKLQSRVSAYQELNTRFNGLKNAAFELTKLASVVGRKASSANTNALVATANSQATPGSYQVEVLRLATATSIRTGTQTGQGNGIGSISDKTNFFDSESVADINTNNRFSQDLTAGSFFVNGQQVMINSGDKLEDIFTKISTATAGAVTAEMVEDSSKGGLVVKLEAHSPAGITVAKGTSNFLNVTKLDTASFDSTFLVSSDAVNAVRAELDLDGSEKTNLAATGPIGSGTLTINGTNISYNGANDSINDIIQRINNSSAGVRASFSNVGGGRVTLTSKDSGPLAVSLADTGVLADALGLRAADSVQTGQSAQISVDGGAVQSFNKNTGIEAAGLDGVVLDLRDDDPNPISVTVSTDAEGAAAKINTFIGQFNSLIDKINELTSYDSSTKSKGVLLADSTVTGVRNRLFDLLFQRIGGLNGSSSLGSLAEIGISTGAIGAAPGTATKLELNTSKLQAALESDPARVAQLLGAAETTDGTKGIMVRIKEYLDGLSNVTGVFTQRSKLLTDQITSIGKRIDTLTLRLQNKQALLEKQFTALETNISRLQAQQNSLQSLFTSN